MIEETFRPNVLLKSVIKAVKRAQELFDEEKQAAELLTTSDAWLKMSLEQRLHAVKVRTTRLDVARVNLEKARKAQTGLEKALEIRQ